VGSCATFAPGEVVESVRLHLNGKAVSVLCKCRACGAVQQYSVADAIAGPVACTHCARQMNIKGAVIEAVDRMPGAHSANVVADDTDSVQSSNEFLDGVSRKAGK